MDRPILSDIVKLLTSIIVCQLAGLIGSIATTPAIPTWYAALIKPTLAPPNWVFAPVWTTLFLLMGISAFFVWRRRLNAPGVKLALGIFAVQLVINILWSFAFFGLRSPLAGLFVIAVLWAAILVTVIAFFRISRAGGALLIPYLLWVSFAALLNALILVLNT